MSRNVIYILTNPSFPQYVKIGFASDLNRRLKELNRSEALPYAFRAYAVYETDHRLTDVALHDLIDRLNPDLRTIETFNGHKRVREFFEMSAEDAYSLLEAIARISGTENRLHKVNPTVSQASDERQAAEAERSSRRPPFRFSMVGLRAGDTIYFINDPNVTAKIIDNRHVEHDGVTTSLSSLAEQLTGLGHALQGPLFFSADAGCHEMLDARPTRLENEHEAEQ